MGSEYEKINNRNLATELYKRAALLGEPNAIKKLKKGF